MFVIAIKDLKICASNSNLFMEKNAFCFEFLAQKEQISN